MEENPTHQSRYIGIQKDIKVFLLGEKKMDDTKSSEWLYHPNLNLDEIDEQGNLEKALEILFSNKEDIDWIQAKKLVSEDMLAHPGCISFVCNKILRKETFSLLKLD